MNQFGIDVETSGVKMLISKLYALKSVMDVQDGGVYHEDKTYSQVWVHTSMTEKELDDWLYRVRFPRPIEIVGVFPKNWLNESN